MTPEVISRLASLIQILESELPEGYRVETYRLLAPALMPSHSPTPTTRESTSPNAPDEALPAAAESPQKPPRVETARLDLAPYKGLLSASGKTLLKSLAALDVAAVQLGVNWLTPAEIERLLVERAGTRSIYRTNISTALSQARGLADRRRRGRGYEYRLTALGRESLHRELALSSE